MGCYTAVLPSRKNKSLATNKKSSLKFIFHRRNSDTVHVFYWISFFFHFDSTDIVFADTNSTRIRLTKMLEWTSNLNITHFAMNEMLHSRRKCSSTESDMCNTEINSWTLDQVLDSYIEGNWQCSLWSNGVHFFSSAVCSWCKTKSWMCKIWCVQNWSSQFHCKMHWIFRFSSEHFEFI